ncbi:hypothetical protein [Actinomadura roseirufa]|uniref:hypothetical protein n=1 Tax=Actinomadura roseirufa TaxID=2094049 RepID=UPI00104168B2|nr:hypothetical protein [Actinomadura roseirufa]
MSHSPGTPPNLPPPVPPPGPRPPGTGGPRRSKALLWGPIGAMAALDVFALILAGAVSNAAGGPATLVWWVWLLLVALSLVLSGVWASYWKRLPR